MHFGPSGRLDFLTPALLKLLTCLLTHLQLARSLAASESTHPCVDVVDRSSTCFVESVDSDGRSATLSCSMSYTWHARAMQFHVVPTVTASLSWDGAASPAKQISHTENDRDPRGRLESTTRVGTSSPDDLGRHTCAVSFTFTAGKNRRLNKVNTRKHQTASTLPPLHMSLMTKSR